eukprot:Phypoly_transcript_02337.p1 GENE.Phypoly_transcript_02337~~Phypoly_transcript_02337.p1  ORF type:complete len:896 (+),score=147.50 Phypoly_transcript_02337:82-2769(+)
MVNENDFDVPNEEEFVKPSNSNLAGDSNLAGNSNVPATHISLHSIYITVGPSGCGKSTFVNNVFVPAVRKALKSDEPNGGSVVVISSDKIRHELLGDDAQTKYNKMDSRLLEISEQAFAVLFAKLKAVTSFPVNTEVVVIDSTGLSPTFRSRVLQVAEENNYKVGAILFQYRNIEDYFKHSQDTHVSRTHLRNMNEHVVQEIKTSTYLGGIIRLKKHTSANDFSVTMPAFDFYRSCFLPPDSYGIIGDLHESVETLKLVIAELKKKHINKFILVGDLLDKGNATLETLEFVTQNISQFHLVRGNHEVALYYHLKGTKTIQKDKLAYFTSVPTLETNERARELFLNLYEKARPFLRCLPIGKAPSFIVTHAPCLNKYLGKIDKVSTKSQQYFYLDHKYRGMPWTNEKHALDFLKTEACVNFPHHIFGHVAFKKPFHYLNKHGVDTGCAYGNNLTGLYIADKHAYTLTKSLDKEKNAEDAGNADLIEVAFSSASDIDINELSEMNQQRLNFIMKNQINFISGTISPSDKDTKANDLESLTQALSYFRSNRAKFVSVQPKEMGSRCQIYLCEDPAKCFSVSRNGYLIKLKEVATLYPELYQKYKHLFEANDAKMIILDGELLPWSALGQHLIDSHFRVIDKTLTAELHLLKESGFEQALEQLKNSEAYHSYAKKSATVSKKDLQNEFGQSNLATFSALQDYLKVVRKLDEKIQDISTYHEQVEIFGVSAPLSYVAFDILKIIKNDGTEKVMFGDARNYALLNTDRDLVIDITTPDANQKVQQFFDKLTKEANMEGVVIKPMWEGRRPWNVAPFMKVRNERYLTLIYGYDYKSAVKYDKLIAKKGIKQKLKASMQDEAIGRKMLEVPFAEITVKNEDYKKLVANYLFEEEKQSAIDPRL